MDSRTPRLVIRRDSWHYRYFLFIRKFWGSSEEPERTSLCPYCQTILWGSFAGLISLPLLAMSWAFVSAVKFTDNIIRNSKFKNISHWLDKHAGLNDMLDKAQAQEVKDHPGLAGVSIAFFTILAAAMLSGVVAIVGLTIYKFVIHVPDIPDLVATCAIGIWWGILYIGYGLFYVFYAIGYGLTWSWHGLVWFFTNGAIWSVIGQGVLWILGVAAVGGVSFFSWMKFSESSFGQRVTSYISSLLPWHVAAKEIRMELISKESEEAADLASDSHIVKPPSPSRFSAWLERKMQKFSNGISWLMNRKISIGDAVVKVVGPFSGLWLFAKALKSRSCPIVEFVDKESLEAASKFLTAHVGETRISAKDKYWYLEAHQIFFSAAAYPRNKGEQHRIAKKVLKERYIDDSNVPTYLKTVIARFIIGQYVVKQTRDYLSSAVVHCNVLNRIQKEKRDIYEAYEDNEISMNEALSMFAARRQTGSAELLKEEAELLKGEPEQLWRRYAQEERYYL